LVPQEKQPEIILLNLIIQKIDIKNIPYAIFSHFPRVVVVQQLEHNPGEAVTLPSLCQKLGQQNQNLLEH